MLSVAIWINWTLMLYINAGSASQEREAAAIHDRAARRWSEAFTRARSCSRTDG